MEQITWTSLLSEAWWVVIDPGIIEAASAMMFGERRVYALYMRDSNGRVRTAVPSVVDGRVTMSDYREPPRLIIDCTVDEFEEFLTSKAVPTIDEYGFGYRYGKGLRHD